MTTRVAFVTLFLGLAVRLLDAEVQYRSEPSQAGSLRLNASAITLTEHFAVPTTRPTVELAIRYIGNQIDQKRTADATEAGIDLLWKGSFLRFIPIAPGGHPEAMMSPVAKDDDPFLTPEYLKVSSRQLDHELALSEKRSLLFFGHDK